MSWMNQLYKTYEYNAGNEQDDLQLVPAAHMNANAQIEITLSQEGEFLAAAVVDKKCAQTLIPVTEDSAARTAKLPPHPLCDMLSYVAGDFSDYCENEKQKKDAEDKFQVYILNLEKWKKSVYTHPKVQAVFRYSAKKIIIHDLIKAGLIELNADGMFADKKISGKSYDKALVRFRILHDGQAEAGTWEDKDLIEAYTKYYFENQSGETDICYFTGQESVISKKHPKGILASDYGAKLVSSNDDAGYTFRGRFQIAEQAYAFSYDSSQKIHSALTWLAKRQGETVGSKDKRMFICWNPQGRKTPSLIEMDEFGLMDDPDMQQTEVNYKKKLSRVFRGYQDQFQKTDDVVIMGLDAATTGRLSVTYYHELQASDFLERILYWGESCNWYYLKFNEKQEPYYAVETPVLRKIALYAFGREIAKEKGNFIDANDKVLKEQTQRLLKCMLEKKQVPFDLVHALAVRASMPMAYTKGNREKVLSTACALIRKYYKEIRKNREEEKDDMTLDLENHDRSYLFGRLLAVCEKVERTTFDKGETRDTNAIRLQSAFVNHPMQTWKILEQLLNPYFQKLVPGLREYYRNLIADIIVLIADEDEKILNHGLKETYLLGYYLQRSELNKKKEENKKEEGSKNEQLTK